jgi:hypothetical protein
MDSERDMMGAGERTLVANEVEGTAGRWIE